MRLAELQQAIRAADEGAVLVPARLLDQLIRRQYQLSNLFVSVPHHKCYVVDRPTLYRHVNQDELDLEPDQLLPPTVILLSRPSQNTLAIEERDALLLTYWRRLFHAFVHRALQKQVNEGWLSASAVRARIETIGASAFAEIRMVLDQEKYLTPSDGEDSPTAVYVEFAAVYLELRYFAANLLPIYFPGLAEPERIEALLAEDVDAKALFLQSRLEGAPLPVFRADTSSDESHDYYRRLMGDADKEEEAGNSVRAAILRTKAERVAPASLEEPTRDKAHNDLRRLTRRLQAALELTDPEADEWLDVLPSLLDKADQGSWPVEAALLYDLQKVGVDNEREIYAVDLITWVTSGGRRPIKRPLPSQRLVRITRHLRSAAQRLTQARLTDDERQHLGRLLQNALYNCEERLRKRIRPILADALLGVGLQPNNPPERTAFARMIEEMLDRIVELGFLTFSDLRDTISRNQLKMPDLRDPYEFARGDPLLRLDRQLAKQLDGVYRPGEVYLRWLERLTAPAFGTAIGRWLTLFLLLPFGGAFVLVQGTQLMLQHYDINVPPVLRGAMEKANDSERLLLHKDGDEVAPTPEELARDPGAFFWPLKSTAIVILGFFLLALLHVGWFRNACWRALTLLYRAFRGLFVDLPAYLAHLPLVQKALQVGALTLIWMILVKPALISLLLWSVLPEAFVSWTSTTITFLLIALVANSPPGKAVGDVIWQSVANFYELLRAGLLPGLLRLLLGVFKRVTDGLEYLLHTVDEWLRFRQGDSRLSLFVRTVAGFFWYPIAWLTRFYLVVLIEPWFNPLKAPVSLLAAKFMVPLYGYFLTELKESFSDEKLPLFMKLAWLILFVSIWLLPDAFGFLFWEMKENWRMYRSNRQQQLRAVSVGPHGETVRQLLQLGFHSGTVPKLYARLREAEREAIRTGSWRTARTWRHSLNEVEQTIHRLVERELVRLLHESTRWKGESLRVGDIVLTPTRISIELLQSESSEPMRLEWEDQAGWLVARIRETGWLAEVGAEARQAMEAALLGLYKLAGIDLVVEQLREHLPREANFTLTQRELVVGAEPYQEPVVYYDLTRPRGPLKPRTLEGKPAANWPPLDPGRVIFARVPLTWQQWVEDWQGTLDGKTPRTLAMSGVRLLPAVAVT